MLKIMGQDTNMLNILCDLVNTSLVDGVDTDIIYSLSTSLLTPHSASLWNHGRSVTFKSVNKNAISSIRVYTCVTHGKRRLINLNGTDTGFSLLLKRIR